MTRIDEQGYTLVEVMVAITLFAILSIGFYQVMFSGVRGSDTTRNVARISEEARLGLNRMVRDTRETGGHCFGTSATVCGLVRAEPDRYWVEVDYNGDDVCTSPVNGRCPLDYAQNEYLQFRYDATAGTITVASLNADGSVQVDGAGEPLEEVLVEGVEQIDPDGEAGPQPPVEVFTYTSNYLEYDVSGDGITTWQEIDNPPPGINGVGDRDTALDDLDDDNAREVAFLSNITYSFRVRAADRVTNFYGEAELRNRRFGAS